ncbi:hypothetical protein [Actinomadura sp. B10D3]|uniref:hypothetical protein n=1 Tax=Actinomadura sp. B10D3 TaxID=3153557 RepID=UPI00325F3EB9
MSRGTPAPGPAADTSAAGPGAMSRVPLLALCLTEITSWGVLYYAFPALAAWLGGYPHMFLALTGAALAALLATGTTPPRPSGR